MRGSIEYQVKQIWRNIDRIGVSKRESRETSGVRSVASGHRVSDGVHSLQYKDEIIKTARQLGNYAKEVHGVRDMQAITPDIVRGFIDQKIANGVKYQTISNQISHLDKIQIGLSKMEAKREEHERLFTRKDVSEIRQYARENAVFQFP